MNVRKIAAALVAATLGWAATATDARAVVTETPDGVTVRPARERTAEVIVQFDPGAGPTVRRLARERADVELGRTLLLPRAQVVRVEGDVDAAVARLERQPGVRLAVPNLTVRAQAAAPNDPRFGELWGLRNVGQTVGGITGVPGADVNVLAAWDATRGAGQVVAVVDTGVALTHPDIAPNLWTNPGEIPDNGVDDDGNGLVDDVHGYDFAARTVDTSGSKPVTLRTPDADPDDFDGHGTHVAGTVAAVADNGIGVAGVAPEAKVMVVRALDGNGEGTIADVAEGIAYAARQGATVINLSLGVTPAPEERAGAAQLLGLAIELAAARGAVVVAAAGNDAHDNDVEPTYPCALRHANLICVAAIDATGAFDAAYSNHGATTVDVAAPGTHVLSAVPAFQTVWQDGFDVLPPAWLTDGSPAWWLTDARAVSSPYSAALEFGPDASALLQLEDPVDLTGERGCRLGFELLLETGTDAGLAVDAYSETVGAYLSLVTLRGTTGGTFASIDAGSLELLADAAPAFAAYAKGTAPTGNDVGIDDVRIRCRVATHDDTHYQAFRGTSMAAPHVAGVAALVRAAAPHASAEEVVSAIKAGTVPHPSLAGKVSTGGRVDAAKAIALAPSVPDTPPTPQPPAPQPPAPQPPAPQPATPLTPAPTPSRPARSAGARRAPCARLRGRRLIRCRATQRVKRMCGRLTGRRKRVCAKRQRAIVRCQAMPGRGRRAQAKRKACLRTARAIGTKRQARRRGR